MRRVGWVFLVAGFAGWAGMIPGPLAGLDIGPGVAAAQTPSGNVRIEIGVEPARVRIGEPFRTAVRVIPPAGSTAEVGDFTPTDSLGVVAPTVAGAAEGEGVAAVYSLAAWVAGAPLAASVPVRITGEDGTVRTLRVDLRLPEVESVLPAAGDSVQPRPPRGLAAMPAPATFPVWWWLLALIGALLALAFGYRLLLREREGDFDEPAADPREWALAQLGAGGAESILDGGDAKLLAGRISWILRAYLERTDRQLGRDLTTTEVLVRFVALERGRAFAPALRDLLTLADLAKFAGRGITSDEGLRMLGDARAWVTDYPPAETADTVSRAA